jgi:Fe-S cluster assembly ATP-binding protein
MGVLKPRYAVLDETDSGLDVDGLGLVGKRVEQIRKENPKMGLVLITHYRRILDYVQLDKVGVMKEGKIVKWGGKKLVNRVEKEGYERFK